MGAIGFVTCLYVFVATCIFGKNGAPEHIELTKYTMAISQGLLGLNVLKEGVNFNIGHNKKDKKEDDTSGETK